MSRTVSSWLSFTLGIGVSRSTNLASAPELNALSPAVAARPPLELLQLVALLKHALKRPARTPSGRTFLSPSRTS